MIQRKVGSDPAISPLPAHYQTTIGPLSDVRDSTAPEFRFSGSKRPESSSGSLFESWKRTAGFQIPDSGSGAQLSDLRGPVNAMRLDRIATLRLSLVKASYA